MPMSDLKTVFGTLGFQNMVTILASGNVVFDGPTKSTKLISEEVEHALHKKFGFNVPTLVYSAQELKDLVASNPFVDVEMTNSTARYVTFVRDLPKNPPTLPWASPQKDFTILSRTGSAVCSVVTLIGNTPTTKMMKFLEKEFGKDITTRNWNTVLKVFEKI